MIRIFLLLCAAVPILGCTSAYTERVADVDPRGWHTDAPATVTILNTDTLTKYDISLFVRVDNTFAAKTLPVTIKTITPDSIHFEETLNLRLKPSANSRKDFYETLIPYRSDAVLGRTGEYTFEISTRTDGVSGIWAIGIALKTK